MAAIANSFRKVVDFVMDGLRGNSPFEEIGGPEEIDDDYEYEEDGNAIRQFAPSYTTTPINDIHQDSKVINHPSFSKGGNEVVVVEPRSFDDAATIVQYLKDL